MTLNYVKGEVTTPGYGKTILDRLARQASERGDKTAYQVRLESGWAPTNWRDYNANIRAAAKALMTLGMVKGDVVCILGFNRPEWTTMDVAAMMAGGMSAGIYQTNSPEEIAFILNHSEAPFIVVEDVSYLERVAKIARQCAHLKTIILMNGATASQIEGLPVNVLSWDDFNQQSAATSEEALDARIADIETDDLAGLIYTSGTTGPPKAVGLPHKAVFAISDNANNFLGLTDDDRLISYLPLSHIAEKALSIYGPMSGQQVIYFARSMEKLPADLLEVKPTIFFAVPRVWEKLQAGLSLQFAKADASKAKTLAKAQAVGREYFEMIRAGKTPPWALRTKFKLYTKLVYKKVQAAIGLDAMNYGYSGAAAIAKETPLFFNGIGIEIANVYGLSENGGGATSDQPHSPIKLGSVGRVIKNFEIRIAEDDEIEMRGNSMFSGYVKDEAATRAALTDDGWFSTGDLGYLDEDGYLFVTGRKKDLIITSGGKNIAPSNLETDLMSLPFIEHAVAVGDGFHFLSALLTLDVSACQQGLGAKGDYTELAKQAVVRDAIRAGIEDVNSHHARVANIREFRILSKPLSVEDGYLTPTLKIKRAKIIKAYQNLVDDIYGTK